ncbi:MAG: TonB-dependent receptor [Bacteroidetes bacterium]|nr:TonB-dependent receptor [Bacteroidota bacterium]
MRKYLILLFLMLSTFLSPAQKKYTISGYLYDSESGEKLIGANVYDQHRLMGTTSNTYGFFSLTLATDTYNLVFSYLGYGAEIKRFILKKDITLNVKLVPGLTLEEVEIFATQTERIEEMSKMSTIKIPVAQIKTIPAMFGEVDVLKALQLLPGVQSGMEGGSGLYVRGGGPDQNLILLDGTPVYNASHLFGFFSVFNADAIKNVELIKGGFPARYGGRLSSVIDISLKEGNLKKIKGEGSIGLIASKFTLEGPIWKDRTSFIIAARRTYLDMIIQPLIRNAMGESQDVKAGYFFYDLNAKINHKLSEKDHLYLSLYMGDDKFYLTQKPYSYLYDGVLFTESADAGLGWGNLTSALRWNHQFSNKLFSNLSITYTQYDFDVHEEESHAQGPVNESFSMKYVSGINDLAAKLDFDFLPNPNHFVKFGANAIYHTFKPGATAIKITSSTTDTNTTLGADNLNAWEYAAYVEDDYRITEHLKANIGLHASAFQVNDEFYYRIQPRVSARYLFDKSWSIKASFASMQQYVHLLTNSTIGLPTDLWVPSTDTIKPQNADQIALGFATSIKEKYQLSIEGYYKKMSNLIEYVDGATFLNTETDWQKKVEAGEGWSYGGEIFFEKKAGKTTGWIGYTLSWTYRQFPHINFGEIFPYKYDRRHDVSIVVSHELGKDLDVSATWIYGTGNAVTLPVVRAMGSEDPWGWGYSEIEYYDKKNDYRMAAYHRLDLSVNWHLPTSWGQLTINGSIYNFYNRRNPFYYYFAFDNRGNRVLKRVSLFPMIPSLSMNFKF